MEKRLLKLIDGNEIKVDTGTVIGELVEKYYGNWELPVVLAKVNNECLELNAVVNKDGQFLPVDISDKLGQRAYARTLQFILIKAVADLYPKARIVTEHSLSKGIYGEIHKDSELTAEDVEKIKSRMIEIIKENAIIKKTSIEKEKAVEIFRKYGMMDKVRLLGHVNAKMVKLYELDGRYDYFYGSMAYSTGCIKLFDLLYYAPGFILRYPQAENPTQLPKFIEYPKLSRIFRETEKWGEILEVSDVGQLDDKVESGEIVDIIRVQEALHEKKIAYVADMISDKKDVKLVLISGPSSSGKTTFARRLGIQLRANGLIPVPVSLDDYFVDRDNTPKDENGEYDFESIYALDLNLFNENLESLMSGKETEIPTYDFKTGKRVWNGNSIKLPSNGVLIVEGIHGLNEMLTSPIPKESKFKIYISALTQLNLDNHNRISTTDVRIIRRIVRDYLSRGYGGETTLKMWPSIKRGEENNIFVFQENADVMFNSTLIYELCILKKYAIEELAKVEPSSPVYYEALRLKSFLHFFKDADEKLVPENSILREFIGGSCFYKY